MKNMFHKTGLYIFAAVLSGCAGLEESNPPANIAKTVVEASAVTPDTRLTIGGMYGDNMFPVFWDGSEEFMIAEFADNQLNAMNAELKSYDFVTEDGKRASFRFDVHGDEDVSAEYYCCAAGPWANVVRFWDVGDDKSVEFTLPAAQRQSSEASVDAAAALVFAVSPESEGRNANAEFVFEKITAYARVTVGNLAVADGDAIVSAGFAAAGSRIAGGFEYFWEKAGDERFAFQGSGEDEITVDVSAFADAANREKGSFDVWFTLLPAGEVRNFAVTAATASGKIYKKNISVPDGVAAPVFTAGRVAMFSVDMGGIKAEGEDGGDAPLPDGGSMIQYKIGDDGSVSLSGDAPAGSTSDYTKNGDDRGNVLAKNESCKLTLDNLGGLHVQEMYVRMRGDEGARATLLLTEPLTVRPDDVGTALGNHVFGINKNVDRLELTVSNNYDAALYIDSFIIVCP